MSDDPDRSNVRLRQVEEARQRLSQGLEIEDVVKYLHGQGLSIVECIWVMSTASGLPLESAKNVVLNQPIWKSDDPGATGGTP